MSRKQCTHIYDDIISTENLLAAWREFLKGKRNRKDVQVFQYWLSDNILSLHLDLKNKTYHHGGYQAFNVSDPKPRNIHKASVRDRLLHHALYRKLYPFFDRTFIADSYSCRVNKGTHPALERFRKFAYQVSHNRTRTCWVLKCDIRKFFASIDHTVLLSILRQSIPDRDVSGLLSEVIGSFSSTREGVGLPLGNLTSQLLANVYLSELDQFVKHRLKAKHYIRYADDFVFFLHRRSQLEEYIPLIQNFLWQKLKLELHPDKLFIKTLSSGVDFLGWVHFPDHRVLRTATKRRMLRKLATQPTEPTIQSYLGLLRHGNTEKLKSRLHCYITSVKQSQSF